MMVLNTRDGGALSFVVVTVDEGGIRSDEEIKWMLRRPGDEDD